MSIEQKGVKTCFLNALINPAYVDLETWITIVINVEL